MVSGGQPSASDEGEEAPLLSPPVELTVLEVSEETGAPHAEPVPASSPVLELESATEPPVWEDGQARVARILEQVAERVRRGEIVAVTDANAGPAAVLASVLASLLSDSP